MSDKFSGDEISLMKNLSLEFGKFQKEFNRKTNPVGLNQQLSSLPTLRMLSALEAKLGRKPAVFEIGGGSGMLGHMCFRKGYKYTNFDITQSFYVFNSAVYSTMYGKQFFDSHKHQQNDSALENVHSSKISLIPWWHFINTEFELPNFDVVVMNHCFFEISRKAINFILTRLSHSAHGRVFLTASEWGDVEFTQIDQGYVSHLEQKFNFRSEEIDGNADINPSGTTLMSFENRKSVINYFDIPLNERLSIKREHGIQRDTVFKKYARKFVPSAIKRLRLRLISKPKNIPRVLGNRKQLIKNNKILAQQYNQNYDDLKKVIMFLEEQFGKPIYTEDEASGFYIDSTMHF